MKYPQQDFLNGLIGRNVPNDLLFKINVNAIKQKIS